MSSYEQSSRPFTGRVITLTGAASGIGLATAEVLWDRGASLSISDINQASLYEVEEALKRRPHPPDQRLLAQVVDITDTDAIKSWISATLNAFGRINHAANIAGGVSSVGALSDKTDEEFTAAIDLNLRGAFNCMRVQFPHLQAGSAIVNVTSMAGLVGVPGVSLYGAAKAGLNTLTAVAAQEQGSRGIRVNAVAPGLIMTPPVKMGPEEYVQASIADFPLRRAGEPEEVAKVIAFLLSDESSYVTGTVLRVDGGSRAMGH